MRKHTQFPSTTTWVYLEDVRPRFLHDVSQAEQMKQSFSHKTLPFTVATQGLTDLGLVCLPCYLFTHTDNLLLQTLTFYAQLSTCSHAYLPLGFLLQRGSLKIQHL